MSKKEILIKSFKESTIVTVFLILGLVFTIITIVYILYIARTLTLVTSKKVELIIKLEKQLESNKGIAEMLKSDNNALYYNFIQNYISLAKAVIPFIKV